MRRPLQQWRQPPRPVAVRWHRQKRLQVQVRQPLQQWRHRRPGGVCGLCRASRRQRLTSGCGCVGPRGRLRRRPARGSGGRRRRRRSGDAGAAARSGGWRRRHRRRRCSDRRIVLHAIHDWHARPRALRSFGVVPACRGCRGGVARCRVGVGDGATRVRHALQLAAVERGGRRFPSRADVRRRRHRRAAQARLHVYMVRQRGGDQVRERAEPRGLRVEPRPDARRGLRRNRIYVTRLTTTGFAHRPPVSR